MDSGLISNEVQAQIGRKRIRTHHVTEHEIIRFGQATGNSVSRVDGVLEAPLLFSQALAYESVPVEELPPDGSPREPHVPIPADRTVGGSSEYEINRRIRAGEVITIESTLKDVYSKHGRSGVLYFVVVETRFTDSAGEPVAYELATFIKKA